MVNFKVLSVVLLLSLTLMLLVLPVILPPLPPPPPFLMLLPVVIFIMLMLIAFLPSGFNAIVVSYVANVFVLIRSCADGDKKRIPVTAQVRNAYQHVFASNSESQLQQDMLIASSSKHVEMIDEHIREDGFAKTSYERLKSVKKLAGTILQDS